MDERRLFDLPFEDARAEPAVVPPARRPLTVSELTSEIRAHMEERFVAVWVEGEISNCRRWNTGHLYFTLKDARAQIRAVMFRSAVRYLRFAPEDGLHVIARGRVAVYEPKGEYQLVCEHLEPHGHGALQLAFEQLKRRLQAEGLFDAARKRPLPALPRKIGIVTSLDGAAVRDIVKVLRRRYPNAHLVVRPTRVQGDGAADDIARGLAEIGRVPGVDVIIVGRGGGSVEDLWAFNEEAVARAIATAAVPVISAVGHEIDFTIADFVADLRAPTPSAAAELVVARKDEYLGRIAQLEGRLRAAAHAGLQRRRATCHALVGRRGMAGWPARLALRGRHLAELLHALQHTIHDRLVRAERRHLELRRRLEARAPSRGLALVRARLAAVESHLAAAAVRGRHEAERRLRELAGRLENLSPLAVLARGYAVCWTDDRSVIVRRADRVAPGERVRITLHQGELACEVRECALDTAPVRPGPS